MKRKILIAPVPALLLLIAIQLVAPSTAMSTCPAPPPPEAPTLPVVPATPLADAAGVELASPEVLVSSAPAAVRAPLTPEAPMACTPTPEEQARSLLLLIRSAAGADTPTLPRIEVREASLLLARAPETAQVFVEALEGAKGALRTFLAHVMYGVSDKRVRDELLAVYRRTDPTAKILGEILSDRGRILAALRDLSEPKLRKDLIGRIGDPLLSDPEIQRELIMLADSDPDAGVRSRAISRLARLDNPEVKRMLLGILGDSGRTAFDRAAVAHAFAFTADSDLIPVFVHILETGAEAPILRLATLGLKKAGHDTRAIDALFRLLLDGASDEMARNHAATALSSIALAVDEPHRTALNGQIRDALKTLSTDGASADVLVHAMGELTRSHRPTFDENVMAIVTQSPTPGFRDLATANPDLKSILDLEEK